MTETAGTATSDHAAADWDRDRRRDGPGPDRQVDTPIDDSDAIQDGGAGGDESGDGDGRGPARWQCALSVIVRNEVLSRISPLLSHE